MVRSFAIFLGKTPEHKPVQHKLSQLPSRSAISRTIKSVSLALLRSKASSILRKTFSNTQFFTETYTKKSPQDTSSLSSPFSELFSVG